MSRNYRNSRTDRLIITWIPIWYSQGNPGKIGMTLCPENFNHGLCQVAGIEVWIWILEN